MIEINRTLTEEEARSLVINGETEQGLANRALETLNFIIDSNVRKAKHKKILDKSLADIETKL